VRPWLLGGCLLALAASSPAEVPFPSCAATACSDPADFAAYLFTDALPDDYDPSSGEAWKYERDSGMGIVGGVDSVWAVTTGRPDVVDAVLDSGIEWDRRDLARGVWLNTGELPVPAHCASHDCNGDGFVSVDDFAEACAADLNGSGFCDGQDLIRFYSDGVDDDGNGYRDDIAGWDFLDDDNDPADDVRYGHGTGEASDQVAEANNGSGFPGFAPSSLFLPLKVGDSFVAFDADFAQAVVYAVDRGVSVISEALGAVSASPTGQAAVDYAYRRGIPILASAADEESRHHNYPANYEHTIWVNSVRDGDGTFLDENANGFDLLNGCTNYGGRAWLAIPSASCSSEATGRAAGLTLLLVSHAKNQIDRGLFTPYPGLGTPFSAEEVRQLLRASARDVDHSADLSTVPAVAGILLGRLLSAPALGLEFGTSRFPTQTGWDQFTGWGRPDGPRLLSLVTDATMPPEVDLSGGPRWFESIDPKRTPSVELRGTLRAMRARNSFDWTLEVGCGVEATDFLPITSGFAMAPIENGLLARWDPAATAAACGFDPEEAIGSPDAHTVTLRLRATSTLTSSSGEDRRTLSIHSDPTLRFARYLGGSGESSAVLADIDRDGVLDIVQASADGTLRALNGVSGAEFPGFPVFTETLAVHPSPAYASGEVPVPREAVIAALAASDLDGDGRVEVVAAGVEGRIYVFDDHGAPYPGFPVSTDRRLSDPAQRDRLNDTDPGVAAAPTLADLDADGVLEILASGLDGHLYAWRADGSPVPGFPVRLADPARVSVDPATGKATALPGFDVRERAAKSLSSPAVGDLDGDGSPEIVVATNEEYGGEGPSFAIESTLLGGLSQVLGGSDELSFDAAGRVYAVHHDGSLHPGGPFVAGWPAPVPLLAPGVLPTVGTGTPGSAALADVDGDGRLEVAIFGAIGPVVLLASDGSPYLGRLGGVQRVLAHDFPAGFPNVPASAGSADAPFFGALGSGAFGDLTGDGLPEYVAPTGGLRKLLDVAAPARQDRVDPSDPTRVIEGFAHHQITAWDPVSGALLEAFPRIMDDMQFIASPALGDVDGDGLPEIVQGSGAYLLRAYRTDGSTPSGFPKLTHGWQIASPALGDVDGDGLVEVVASTREGWLFVWDTPGLASAAALPWARYGRDARNSQNLASAVANVAPAPHPLAGLGWSLEAIETALDEASRTRPSRKKKPASSLSKLVGRGLESIDAGGDKRVHALVTSIERKLRKHAVTVPGLDHDDFVDSVRGALRLAIDQTDCAGQSARCTRRLGDARAALDEGDRFHAESDGGRAVLRWRWGLQTLERIE
jgi:hypothetical protein